MKATRRGCVSCKQVGAMGSSVVLPLMLFLCLMWILVPQTTVGRFLPASHSDPRDNWETNDQGIRVASDLLLERLSPRVQCLLRLPGELVLRNASLLHSYFSGFLQQSISEGS